MSYSYQPGGASGFNPGADPLSNGTTCLRDAAIMQSLGINTIRVYNLDGDINHDLCASIFNAVGIYMLLDVNSPLPGQSLNSGDPGSSYNADYLTRTFGVVEAFKNYPNTLGFFGGNEVINNESHGQNIPPYLRSVTRDLKNYIARHSTRSIPVGYSAADVRPLLADTWEYLQCAIDGDTADMSSIDFFGLNSYSWCGTANYQSSTYQELVALFSNTTVPVFFSEYGCIEVKPRVWNEVQALYGPEMTPVFSGGIVYEYVLEVNNYGLVSLNANNTASLLTDFDNLQSQYNKLNITLLESGNSTATQLTPPTCRSSLVSSNFNSNFTIPPVPPGGQDLIDDGISNPNNGKLVQVTEQNVPQTIYSSNGAPIQGLAIRPLPDDQSNVPGGENTSGTATTTESGTGTSATPSTTTRAAAGRMEPRLLGLFATVGILLSFFLT